MLNGLRRENPFEKKTRCPITAARLERVLDMAEILEDPQPDCVRVSSLFKLNPREFILNYWRPKAPLLAWGKHFYTAIGTLIHSLIQTRLFEAGVLYCPGCSEFSETVVYNEEYHIRGHIDGLISPERLEALDKGLPLPEWTTKYHFEIKTVSSDKFKFWKTDRDLPEDYRCSATAYQRLLGTDATCFLLVCRDDRAMRTLLYHGEDHYWNESIRKAKLIWKHVKNHTLPPPSIGEAPTHLDNPEVFSRWVEEMKASQPDRVFRD